MRPLTIPDLAGGGNAPVPIDTDTFGHEFGSVSVHRHFCRRGPGTAQPTSGASMTRPRSKPPRPSAQR